MQIATPLANNPYAAANAANAALGRRDDKGGSGFNFAQLLDQHVSGAPEPESVQPQQQPAPKTNDMSAARLEERRAAERLGDQRKTEANQQAAREAERRNEQDLAAKREARAQADKNASAGNTPQTPPAESPDAAKAKAAGRRDAGSADKTDAKAGTESAEAGAPTEAKAAKDDTDDATPATATVAEGVIPPEVAERMKALAASLDKGAEGTKAKGAEAATDLKSTQALQAGPGTAESDKADKGTQLDASQLTAALQAQHAEKAPQSEAAKTAAEPTPLKVEATGNSALPTAALAAPAPRAPESTPPPVPLSFATPITSPDFSQALGMQVSILAQDGIQHAQLHLNPAETGPISIQITLDGTQAKVDFQATSAATRDAISAGMPELAAALQDAGLTLSGGGVFEHGRGRNDQDAPTARQAAFGMPGHPDDQAPTNMPAPTPTRITRGAVDLYA